MQAALQGAADEVHAARSSPPLVDECNAPGFSFGAGWDDEARDEVERLAKSPAGRVVASELIAAVCGRLYPHKSVNGAAVVRDLGTRLERYDSATLRRVATRLLADRTHTLPGVPDIVKIAAFEAATATSVAVVVTAQACDPALAAEWGRFKTALIRSIGQVVFDAWFQQAVVVSKTGNRLVIDAGSAFHNSRISQHFYQQVVAAAQTVWPEIADFVCPSRRATS